MSLSSTIPVTLPLSARAGGYSKKEKTRKTKGHAAVGQFGQVVRNDLDFLKKSFSKGIKWANKCLHLSRVSKTINDIVWLRNLEDPQAERFQLPSWPHPYYPELSGLDLMMADLKALETYASYFYYRSKVWSKPLPEVYDPEDVANYFSCRPHLVALRILEVLSSFASATIRIRLSGFVQEYRQTEFQDSEWNVSQFNFGIVLKQTLLNLGPTFIKVGQSLSTRPDIIGKEISTALSELHDQIPPFPKAVAMKIIEEELGSSVNTFFSYISEEPVAAASFGQVYRATTLDGITVAVKVQRPNLRHVVVRDIFLLRLGLGLVQKIFKRKSDPRLYADELGKGLVGELDYTLEAANALRFMEAHAPYSFMSVPKVFHQLTRKRVLTMEWMVGDNPVDLLLVSTGKSVDRGFEYSRMQQPDAKRRLLDLVKKGVEASLVQLLETGLLHADPHPGNLRYTSSGQIGFLNFGLLCQMERKHQFAMLSSIVDIVNGDWASLVNALTEMDVVRPGTNIRRVTMDLEDALGEVVFKDGLPDIKFSKVLGKIWSVALKYHFRMPPYYTLVLRSIASLEGLAVAADSNFKTFEAAYPYVVRKLLTENSPYARRILHSVVFNRRKEFRWQRLGLFLRVVSTRTTMQQLLTSNTDTSNNYSSTETNESVFGVANLVLKLLSSKDGIVLRRLIWTADGASLIRSVFSKEAQPFRQQLRDIVASVLYHRTMKALGRVIGASQYTSSSSARVLSGPKEKVILSSSNLDTATVNYEAILRDRPLKLIFFKVMKSGRRDPVLMLKLCWASLVVIVSASALACHRIVVSLSEAYIGQVSVIPKRVAVGA